MAVLAELAPFAILYFAVEALLRTPQAFAQELLTLAPWLVGGIVLKYMAYGVAYLISHHAAYAIMASTRSRLAAKLDDAPLHWIHAQGSGALKQSVIQDVERMEAFIAHHTVEVAAAVLAPLCVTTALLWVDWRLAMAALAVGPLALLASTFAMRGVGQNQDRFNRATASLNNVTVEYLRNMPVLKVFSRSASGFRLLRRQLHAYYRLTDQITRNTVPGWALFTSVLGAHLLLLLPVGAWLHARGGNRCCSSGGGSAAGGWDFSSLLKSVASSWTYRRFSQAYAGWHRYWRSVASGGEQICRWLPPYGSTSTRSAFAMADATC
ncbi:ABC transporter transmembrane domain-containing protein [Pseudomonas aeruginosa]|nr:ABC transporter transmembrane domain-containing protein [Pseudomonas aeruginosa]